MTNPCDPNKNDSYWKYLEENSKVVATWPDWLRGARTRTNEENQSVLDQQENEKLAS